MALVKVTSLVVRLKRGVNEPQRCRGGWLADSPVTQQPEQPLQGRTHQTSARGRRAGAATHRQVPDEKSVNDVPVHRSEVQPLGMKPGSKMFHNPNRIPNRGWRITPGMEVRRELREEDSKGMGLQALPYPRTAEEMLKHEYSPREGEQDRWRVIRIMGTCATRNWKRTRQNPSFGKPSSSASA
jgi:hypothetical protein